LNYAHFFTIVSLILKDPENPAYRMQRGIIGLCPDYRDNGRVMGKRSHSHIDLDIRSFRRYPKEVRFAVPLGGRSWGARTLDYSVIGVGMIIEGAPPVNSGDDIALDVGELHMGRQCRIVWAKEVQSGLRVGVLKTGPLTGSLELYPLSDILIGLQRTLKTGILSVRQDSLNKKIHFSSGNMVFATSDHERDDLGEVFLKDRKITMKQYEKVAEIMKKTAAPSAEILMHMGYLKPSDLFSALELQAKGIIGTLFAMKDATFEFVEGPLPSKDAATLNVSVADLVYNAVKTNADLGLIEVYLLDRVVDFSSTPLNLFQKISLTEADRMVLSFIDGKTSIRDIVRLSPLGQEELLRTVYALLEARFLVLKTGGESPGGFPAGEIFEGQRETGNELVDEIEKMYSGYEKLDYYRILGLDRHVGHDRIKKAYYRAAKKYHPDLHLGLPEDTQKKLLDIFTYITNAYLILSNASKRKEYDGAVSPDGEQGEDKTGTFYGPSPLEKDVERKEYEGHSRPEDDRFLKNAEIARARFLEGKTKFTQRDFSDAARLFAMAIYFDGSRPEYHFSYGRSLAGLENLKEAAKALNRANELKPLDADILAELGHVYLGLGFPLRARGYFDRAVQYEPSHKRAREGIGVLTARDEKRR
jgi:curved DNA-binding protein CbpA